MEHDQQSFNDAIHDIEIHDSLVASAYSKSTPRVRLDNRKTHRVHYSVDWKESENTDRGSMTWGQKKDACNA